MNALPFVSLRTFGSVFLGSLSLIHVTSRAAPSSYTTPYYFTTIAGSASIGSSDGIGSAARFYQPFGVATDSSGNVYVADQGNHTIRKISPDGAVTTLAGMLGGRRWSMLDGPEPDRDGTGSNAVFNYPQGLAADAAGNVYVADESTIRKITPAGVVTTMAGLAGPGNWGTADGTGSEARFNGPQGVAVDRAGNVYVADTWNHAIRKITPTGVVTTLAGKLAGYPPADGSIGSTDGAGSAARFNFPQSVAVDAAGNVFVADTHNNTIRKITPEGSVTTLAGLAGSVGAADGTGSSAQFNGPYGVTVDSAGNVYVADNWNRTVRKISPAGVVTTLAGTTGQFGSADGIGRSALFGDPVSVAADSAGNIFVADLMGNTIRKITSTGTVSTVAGVSAFDSNGHYDGPGVVARFSGPQGTAADSAGNVYVADTVNQTIRKIAATGEVTTLAGSAGSSGSTDGAGTTARFFNPKGVAADGAGNVFVTDNGNQTIRKITPTGMVTTAAGTAGSSGSADGAASTARFAGPDGIAADGADNIYVADNLNHTIRKMTSAGMISTLAGSAGSSGFADGSGTSARFTSPEGLATDAAGNIYVADTGNFVIRKISPTGAVSTLAGAPGQSGWNDGAAGDARFQGPEGIAVDGSGNIYVTDNINYSIRETTAAGTIIAGDGNYTIRKITPAGVVSTVAGVNRGSTDGVGSKAQFDMPYGIAADKTGNIYVSCSSLDSNTIRKGQLAGAPVIATQPLSQAVATGASVQFSVTAGGVPAPTYQWFFNGNAFNGATTNTLSFTNARSTDAGDYTVVVTNSLGSVTSKKATLTVSAAPVPPPTPSPAGGGGALEGWFALALIMLAATRGRLGRAQPKN